MAKIDDYLSQTEDNIQEEITDAVVKTEERAAQDPVIPDRFQGKSVADVAQSYTELEKLYSRQAQDLGAMRGQVDELVRQSTQSAAKPEEVKPITVDDLYDNPQETIEKIVERKLQPTIEEQTQRIRQATQGQQRLAAIDQQYPNWRQDVTKPEFNEWVLQTNYRQRMAAAVRDQEDFDAADDLLAQYYSQTKQAETVQKEVKREKELAAASTITGGAAYSEPRETYSRTELMDVRIRAKQGDRNADQWLRANGDAIAIAYEEGRVVD